MPITIPNRKLIKPTTKPALTIPAVAAEAILNPGPVKVKTAGSSQAGNPICEPADGATLNQGYLGFNIRSNVPAGAATDDEALAVQRGVIIEGFAGVDPGKNVWVDDTVLDPEDEDDALLIPAFSGLTHTDPADGTPPIGVGATTTKVFII